eukprot:1360829-Pyramimonas_sp.AAC.1
MARGQIRASRLQNFQLIVVVVVVVVGVCFLRGSRLVFYQGKPLGSNYAPGPRVTTTTTAPA